MTLAEEPAGLLVDTVYARLVDRILSGELAPGTALSVPALAAEMDVSRSPVRESVQRLIVEGLAVHVPRAGAKVGKVTAEDFAEVMAVRELLDGYAAQEAAVLASTSEIAHLHSLLAEQEAQIDAEPDPLKDSWLDLNFHTAVRDLARNSTLSGALHRLDTKAHLYNSSLWSDPHNRRLMFKEHRRIVQAIDSGDSPAARRAAESHVASVLVRTRRRAADGEQDIL